MAYTPIPNSKIAVGVKWEYTDLNTYIANNMSANPPDIFTTKGDIAYATGSQALTRLPVGTAGQILGVAAGVPAWLSGGAPLGIIIIWSGAVGSIPSGWSLCDGNNSTPDLRGKFVIGAGDTYAVAASGGANSLDLEHSHTANDVAASKDTAHVHTQAATGSEAAHTHAATGTTGAASGTIGTVLGDEDKNVATETHTHTINGTQAPKASHTHTNPNTDSNNFTHGHGISIANDLSATQSIMPPYYALAFIQRTS